MSSSMPPTREAASCLSEDVEDIAAEILLKIVDDDYGVLKRFKGISSLPTYLTVIARRIGVKD